MYRFKLTTRFKITIVLLALAVVLSIGAGLGYAFFFGSTNVNLNKGLVGHWDFGAGSTTTATPDRTPNNNDGAVTGATLTTDRKGQTNKAYSFNGTSDYVQAGDTGFPIGTSSRTVGFWTKRAVSSNFAVGPYPFFYGTKTQYQGFGLYGVDGTTDINFYGHAYDFDTGINLDDTNWHYIAITFDGTNLRAYKDGVLISTTDRSLLNTVLGSNQFVVGSFKAVNQYWNGSIDDVRIYNRALTAAEVTALYNSYDPGAVVSTLQKGLVGHWDFGAGSTTAATPDRTPYNNDGTVTGATLTTDRKSQSSKAYSFDGTDDLINVNGITSGGFFGNAHTISAWAKLAGWTTNQAVFGTNITPAGTGDYITIDFSGAGTDKWNARTRLASSGVNENSVASTNTYTNDTNWHHLVLIVNADGTIANFYVDGIDQGSASTYTYDLSTMTTAYIGQLPYTSANINPFNGSIDDVRVYNRALSATEITALYESYNPGVVVSDLQKGLVGHWKFNGTAQDSTPRGNDGTVTEAVLTTDRKEQSDRAYDFDGTNDIIQTANSLTIFNIASELTYSAWFYVDTGNSGWQRPFQKFQDLSDGNVPPWAISYGMSTAATFGCEFKDSDDAEYRQFESSSSSPSGSWYHVTCVASQSAGTFDIYVNGVDKGGNGTWFTSGTIHTESRPITMGGARLAGTYWNGKIDDVRIYNRALTAAEVLDLYNSYK